MTAGRAIIIALHLLCIVGGLAFVGGVEYESTRCANAMHAGERDIDPRTHGLAWVLQRQGFDASYIQVVLCGK